MERDGVPVSKQSLADHIADRIVFMHQGRVLAEGDPQTVLDRSDLVEIYFGGGH